jgi:hypothetical protein
MEAPDSNKAFLEIGDDPGYFSGKPAIRVVDEGATGKGMCDKISGRNMHPVMQKTNIGVIQRFTLMLWGENAI